MEVFWRHFVLLQPELHLSDKGREDNAQLEKSELFTNTSMSSSTKWLIRTFCSFAYRTETIIDFLAFHIIVLLRSLCSKALGVRPPVGIERSGVLPWWGVKLRDCRWGEDVVTFGNHVGFGFRRCGKRRRNRHVVDDLALRRSLQMILWSYTRKLTIMLWMGGCILKVSRMTEFKTVRSFISSYCIVRNLPSSPVPKSLTCSS